MKYLCTLMLLVFAGSVALCQVQFNGIGSLFKGSGYYDNHAYMLGGGISGQYMIKEQFFIGATYRQARPGTTAYPNYNVQDGLNAFTGNIDVYFRKRKPLQPYIGVGAGVSNATHMIAYVRHNTSFTIYSLRGGFKQDIGKSTGFFAHIQYNYTPGDGHPYVIDGINNQVLTEPVSKFFALEAGLFIRLYMSVK